MIEGLNPIQTIFKLKKKCNTKKLGCWPRVSQLSDRPRTVWNPGLPCVQHRFEGERKNRDLREHAKSFCLVCDLTLTTSTRGGKSCPISRRCWVVSWTSHETCGILDSMEKGPSLEPSTFCLHSNAENSPALRASGIQTLYNPFQARPT